MKQESDKIYNKRLELKKSLIYKRFNLENSDSNVEKSKKMYEKKPHLNLCIIGHVDAGKSTMMGHLLYKYGNINKKQMHKFTKESNEMGKSSFKYAWVMDCHEEERARGITVDVSTNYFETENRCITILDNPGHKDFIPNMITGVAQADTGILVINGNINEFENDFSDKGQTKEHALIAKSLGINQLIVAVNKMDKINWDKERFEMIKAVLMKFLKNIGFKSKNLFFVPISGLSGVNLIPKNMIKNKEKSNNNKNNNNNNWYEKEYKTLIEIIDQLKPTTNLKDCLNDLRISITDIYKEMQGISVTGKILSGSIVKDEQIIIQPLNLITKVKELISVENHEIKFRHNIAIKGDNIALLITLKDNELFEQIRIGDIITNPQTKIQLCFKIEVKIVTVKELKVPLCAGQHIFLHTHSIKVPCVVVKINSILNKKNGEIIKNKPRHIGQDACGIVTIKVKSKKLYVFCLDEFEKFKELGRVTFRREGQTVALGLVHKLL